MRVDVSRHLCSTCPSVPASPGRFPSPAHPAASAPFRARPPGPVSGRLCPALAEDQQPAEVSRRLSACRHSLLSHPVLPGTSAPLTVGPPAPLHQARRSGGLLTRFPRSARMSCGRDGRLPAAGPRPRLQQTVGRALLDEAHRGSLNVRPPGLPLARSHQTAQQPFGVNPELRTPDRPDLPTHVRAGTSPGTLAWSYPSGIPDLQSVSSLIPCDLVSHCSRQQCRALGVAPGARLLCGLSGTKRQRRRRATTPDFHLSGRRPPRHR